MAFGFASTAIAVTLLLSATAALARMCLKQCLNYGLASDLPFMLPQIQADVQGRLK